MDARDNELEKLETRLRSVEQRLSVLEDQLSGKTIPHLAETGPLVSVVSENNGTTAADEESKGLESAIGRIGLAWIGMIVLLFGIIFFTEYMLSKGSAVLSVAIGYLSVIIIYFIARYLRKSNPGLYLMFGINGLIVMFYVTMRLHFFSASPVIGSKTAVIILMLLIAAFSVFLSFRRNIQSYGTLAILFTVFTAVVSDTTHIMLPLATMASAGAVYYFYKNRWSPLLVVTIILTYTIFFLWMFSNPAMKHTMQLLAIPRGGYLYLFAIGGCFSLLPLLREKDGSSDDFIIGMIIVHGLLFTVMLGFVTISYFKTGYVSIYAAVTIACLIYSVVLKEISRWNFPSAFFALYGFMAMSIFFYGLVGFPNVYLLLSLQSLVVVAMALWFRNRLMIIMNSLLLLIILFIYLLTSRSVDGVNFSIALVSLVSARIINWKRERLEIKTDLIRNLYLIIGFFMIMVALYNAVPKQFVALSWTIAALIYFGLSFVLRNVKYRYMALGTMISAAVYLFVVDLARIEVIYRVFALLFLAIVSIGISIYYTNRIRKPED
jgi:hypothetical protein